MLLLKSKTFNQLIIIREINKCGYKGICMKIAICDDYNDDVQILYNLLCDYAKLNNIHFEIDTYLNEKRLLERLNEYDILFLDIILQDITGIQLAEKIRTTHKDIDIVFISSSNDYTIDAFHVKAFTYLLKPIIKKDLFNKMDKLMLELCVDTLSVEDDHHYQRNINKNNIAYIEVVKKKTIVHLRNNSKILVPKTLTWWKTKLDSEFFRLCYKGVLVNIKHIYKIDGNKIILSNQQEIYLSRKYKKEVLDSWYYYIDRLL